MNKITMKDRFRYAAPSTLTYLALGCGFISIILTADGHRTLPGLLILTSAILDALDGIVARKLRATSPFGLQLDSLADEIDLGVAPAFLAYKHIQDIAGTHGALVGIICIVYVMAGAFRLARFNLQAGGPKKSDQTIGLTISTSGALLTLTILTSLAYPRHLPGFIFLLQTIVLALLMVSRIRFPALHIVSGRWRWNLTALVVGGTASFIIAPQTVALFMLLGYVGFGLLKSGYRALV
ncbi:MAG: CDP-diacylglycerol--serine O-phosphatidyltransferase [Chloroflexota bacterium]|nr:CDP-diacylglycerol--serine O-phosphatidyltransferase [Chloroflexota bacterium]